MNNAGNGFGKRVLPANLHLVAQEWLADLVDMVNPVAAPALFLVVVLLLAGTAAADPQPDPGANGHQGDGNNGNGNGNDGEPGDNGNHGGQGDGNNGHGGGNQSEPGDNGNHGGQGDGSGGGSDDGSGDDGNATADGPGNSIQTEIQDRMSCPLFRANPQVVLDPNGCYRDAINRAVGVPPIRLILSRMP